jgi:hypothetical protein
MSVFDFCMTAFVACVFATIFSALSGVLFLIQQAMTVRDSEE